ncbi:LuxR C-terminal-related transcriptional regulator [Nocardioides caeni]|uniref:HTH luxR-type domain-containing protein n=1 Tax=Nocardioides caeni TaxID=574700 RepID=A0A4S8N6F8_9ACTN|nr:LuxR C-terminal-related transcriptional regulator [Nocardioides caeni]THV11222.1 hypothetical protein E9934_13100 [Nocardioides caeni]
MHMDDLVEQLAANVIDGRCVVLSGRPGSGRTHAARHLGELLQVEGYRPLAVTGSDGDARVPLGAFAPLLAAHGLGVDANDDETSLALIAYTRLPSLLAGSRAPVVVIVDDADRLDPASAVLIGHLARAGVRAVLTTCSGARLPRAVEDGITTGAWVEIRHDGATTDELLALAAAHVGAELSAGAAADLLARADGLPAIARALVTTALLRSAPGGAEVEWRHPIPTTVRRWSVDPAALGAEERRAAETVAVAGHLPAGAVAAVPGLDTLVGSGLLTETAGSIAFTRRLDRDVVRASTPGSVARLRATRAHEVLLEAGHRWRPRATLLAVRAGLRPAEADVLHAARQPELTSSEQAELLAVAPGNHPATALLLGAAASAAGDLDTAGAHLERARDLLASAPDPVAHDELAVRLAHEIGLLHAVRRGDAPAAVRTVNDLLTRVDGTSARRLIETDLVKWRLMAGEEGVNAPVLDIQHVGAAGTVSAAMIGAMIASLDGTRSAAEREVAAGLAALERTDIAPPHARSLLDLSRFLALVFDGELGTADELATQRRDTSALDADPALGMWEYAAAELALHTGRLDDAAVLSERAVRHLAWHDFTGLRASADALRQAVAVRRGGATSARVSPEDEPDVKAALHLARVATAHSPGAVGVLVNTAYRALAEMHGHLGILALDEAWMLSRSPDLAEEIVSLAGRGGIAQALADRVSAHVDGSAHQVARHAAELEEIGLLGRAADCWEQAARLHQESGRHDAASRCRRAATVLRSSRGLGTWPARTVLLSPRETQIAQLAAQRVRSREIGERLGLSVRTVDNHLARVYRKLGVSGRDELVLVLAEATGAR